VRHTLAAAGAAFRRVHDRVFPEAGNFEGKQPLATGGHATAATGAALRFNLYGKSVGVHGEGLEGELKLLPGSTLDLGARIVAGAGSNHHCRRLFARPAAGEAELIVDGWLFHDANL
jgi:hypothetical protein